MPGAALRWLGDYDKYPDDDCILVETLILNHNENILYLSILYCEHFK